MKKTVFLLAALCVFTLVNAQDSPVRFGAKGGVNLSNINFGDIDANSKMGFGFHLGGVMEYSFSESLALQPALLFMQNGGKLSDSDESVTYRFNQIQLPVNLKYKFGSDELKMFVTAGPYLGYMLSANMKMDGVSIDLLDKDLWNSEDMDPMKRLDCGIGFGVGVELNQNINIGLGYQLGLNNLDPNKDSKLKIGTIQLSVGYFF